MPEVDHGRSEYLHSFYASLVCAAAKARDPRIEAAFRAVKREPFVGPGPWLITLGGHAYVQTPNDDPAFIYQNTLVALDSAQGLNIAMPSAHAYWLDGCDLQEGESVLQVGVGTGYYTAILAHLVGPGGEVHAYEIDESLTEAFLKGWERVRSLRLDSAVDDSCWFAGDGWWLSTAEPEAARED